MVSIWLKDEEKETLKDMIIAYDFIAIIVNKNNKIENLRKE